MGATLRQSRQGQPIGAQNLGPVYAASQLLFQASHHGRAGWEAHHLHYYLVYLKRFRVTRERSHFSVPARKVEPPGVLHPRLTPATT